MSKLKLSHRVSINYDPQTLSKIFKDIEQVINQIAEGQIAPTYNARTSVPVAGDYKRGDFIRNSSTLEIGTVGSKYIVAGWLCSTAPLTFKECRYLTGN